MSALTEPEIVGAQRPRLMLAPDYKSSAGSEAVELTQLAGLALDPWQQLVLEHSLAEGEDGRWAAVEIGLCVPRQNGKNVVLLARELAALFLTGEELTIHSAQQFKTAKEHFLRLLMLIESVPDFDRRVRRVSRTHGEEGIELKDGTRILFFARTKSAGRGFTAPLVIFDEAMFLPETAMGALVPMTSAVRNRQRWYAGSAVDQLVHADGVVFARLRERAMQESPRMAWFEWSLDFDRPTDVTPDIAHDERLWAVSNPGLGIRIMHEAIDDELRILDARTLAVERFGVGDWPDTSGEVEHVISSEKWAALVDDESRLSDPVCFAYDIAPDRASSAIAAAGRRVDGLYHVEVVEHRRGTGWLVPRLAQLRERWETIAVMADGTGPAGSLVHRCEDAGFGVETVSAAEHAKACGQLVDLVDQELLRHLGSDELASALRGAIRRPLGDAWAWSRKNSTTDISPLVAATLALWGATTLGWDPNEDPVIF